MNKSEIFLSTQSRIEDIINLKIKPIITYLKRRKLNISWNKYDIATRAPDYLKTELGVSDSLSSAQFDQVPTNSGTIPT